MLRVIFEIINTGLIIFVSWSEFSAKIAFLNDNMPAFSQCVTKNNC